MKTTDVVIVADVSGSMRHLQKRQQEAIWAIIRELAKDEAEHLALVSIQPFGSAVGENCTPFKAASQYREEELSGLVCNQGSTRLMDAVVHALHTVQRRGTEAALVQVVTDGGENASRTWNHTGPELAAHMARGNLTIALTGPHEAGRLLRKCGLPDDNFRPWDGRTEKSYGETVQATQTALSTYTAQRKAGATRSVSYYVDPAKLTTPGVRSMAKAVTPTEVRTVSGHMSGRAIADFFKVFEKGKHYYQLIKPEYIQEDKDLVVHIKDQSGPGEFRQGSRTIRMLLGLPETGRIRVRPGPVSDKYDVYVQSASVNRKLVEGQKLLTLG